MASIIIVEDGTGQPGGRALTDGVVNYLSAIITSNTANFQAGDVGTAITAFTGIPAGTTILSVQSATQATMTNTATVTASGINFTVGGHIANSYCSVVAADAYMLSELDSVEWVQAQAQTVAGYGATTYSKQEAALINASFMIDAACRFKGFRKSMTQGLEWPRIRAKNEDFYGQMPGRITALLNVYYDESSIPQRLVQATAQVALDLLRDSTRQRDNPALGIRDASIGSGALHVGFDQSRLPGALSVKAKTLLQKLIRNFRYGSGNVSLVRVQ